MAVHEEILRYEADSEEETGSDDVVVVKKQVGLLRRAYQRNGGWAKDKDERVYSELFQRLGEVFGHKAEWQGVKAVEKWNAKEAVADSEGGVFATPTNWEFMDPAEEKAKRRNLLRLRSAHYQHGHYGHEHQDAAGANGNVDGSMSPEARDRLVTPPSVKKQQPQPQPGAVYQNGNGVKA